MACISLPTAALIGSGLSAAGGVASGIIGSNAASKAAKLQYNAAMAASNNQLNMFGQIENMLSPFIGVGESAIGTIEGLMGLSTGMPGASGVSPGYKYDTSGLTSYLPGRAALGNLVSAMESGADPSRISALVGQLSTHDPKILAAVNAAVESGKQMKASAGAGMSPGPTGSIQQFLESTPGYKFTLDQGLQATQNSYAAQGLAQSGSALKGAAQYATGLANATYEQRLGDYLKLLSGGQSAATSLAQFGSNAAMNASNFATSGAAAQAGGVVGSANALTSGLGSATSGISNAALLLGMNNAGMFGAPGSVASGTGIQPVGVTPDVYGQGGFPAPYMPMGGYPTTGG
jgi:hypothetical protein